MLRSATLLVMISGCLALTAPLQAQQSDSSDVSNQLWADYYGYWHFKPTIQFYGDAGFRYLLEDGSWASVNIRPSVRFMQGNWIEPRGGLGLFYTYNEESSNQLEIRPWQGLMLRWPSISDRFHLHHYFRAEERFQFDTQDDWDLHGSFRLRYRIGTGIPLPIFHPVITYRYRSQQSGFLTIPTT